MNWDQAHCAGNLTKKKEIINEHSKSINVFTKSIYNRQLFY